ncbi:polyprenol monophosphomannose synthase [Nanoarchaeota archaeon]
MITIVIPTYNEAQNIEKLISLIFKVKLKEKVFLIFVDDNSPDGTGKMLDKLAKKHKGAIKVIHRKDERGLGSAYVRGFQEALKTKASVIFGMDADLSHDPKYLPDFMKKIREGYDIVQGSRYMEGGGVNWSWHRIFISKSANLFATTILGLDVHDVTGSYKAYKREVMKALDIGSITSNGFSFFEEILYRAKLKGYKIGETPIFFTDRKLGKSKLSKIEMFKFFVTIIRLRIFLR